MQPPAVTDPLEDIARELANVSVHALTRDGKVHPGTVVAATARMAGTYLFRALNRHLPAVSPGHVVLSPAMDEHVPVLSRIAAAVLTTNGVDLDESTAELPIAPQHEPRQAFGVTQPQLEPLYRAVTSAKGLSDADAARASAVAVGLLISQCVNVLDASQAFRIAAYGFVEGAKTVPDPVRL